MSHHINPEVSNRDLGREDALNVHHAEPSVRKGDRISPVVLSSNIARRRSAAGRVNFTLPRFRYVDVRPGDLIAYEYVDDHNRQCKWELATVVCCIGDHAVEVDVWRANSPSSTKSSHVDRDGASVLSRPSRGRVTEHLDAGVCVHHTFSDGVPAKDCHRQSEVAEEALAAATRELEAARVGIQEVTSVHLHELQSYRDPPEIVHFVMSAVMLLLCEPARTWQEMVAVTRQPGFLHRVATHSPSCLGPERREELIHRYIMSTRFSYLDAVKGSYALGQLYNWVMKQASMLEANNELAVIRRSSDSRSSDGEASKGPLIERCRAAEMRLKSLFTGGGSKGQLTVDAWTRPTGQETTHLTILRSSVLCVIGTSPSSGGTLRLLEAQRAAIEHSLSARTSVPPDTDASAAIRSTPRASILSGPQPQSVQRTMHETPLSSSVVQERKNALEHRVTVMEKHAHQLRVSLAESVQLQKKAKDDARHAIDQKESMEQRYREVNVRLEQALRESADLQKANTTLSKENVSLTRRNKDLTEFIAKQEEADEHTSSIAAAKETLTKQYQEALANIEKAKNESAGLRRRFDELTKQLKKQEQANDVLQRKQEAAEHWSRDVASAKEAIEKQYREATERLEKAKKDAESLQKNNTGLKKLTECLHKNNDELTRQLNQQKKTVSEWQDKLKDALHAARDATSAKEAIEGNYRETHERLEKAKNESAGLRRRVDELTQQLKKQEQASGVPQRKQEAAEHWSRDVASAKEAIEKQYREATERLEKVEKENIHLKKVSDGLARTLLQYENEHLQSHALREEKGAVATKQCTAKEHLQAGEERSASMQTNNTHLMILNDELKRQNDQLTQLLQEQKQATSTMQHKADEARRRAESANTKHESLQHQYNKILEDLADAQQKAADLIEVQRASDKVLQEAMKAQLEAQQELKRAANL